MAARKRNQLSISIIIFVLAQVSWFALLSLFIYRFFISRSLASRVAPPVPVEISQPSTSLLLLVGGCILYVAVSVAMALIFKNYSSQLRMTKMYDTFIANITHELKSPLASIHLHLETLSYRQMSDAQRKTFLDLMLKDATRLDSLINAILKISALEQKRDVFEVQVHNAQKVITPIVKSCREQFFLTEQQLTLTGSADALIVVDKNALQIVFDNIIDNAIKYSLKPPQIDITVSTDNKSVVIRFKDAGIGISPKDQKKIFQKFQRIAHRRSPSVKGSGLGLYWVREIIRYHAGQISVFSEGEGKGTTFTIRLPIYQRAKTRYLNSLLKWTNRKKRQQDRLYEQTTI